MSGRRAYIDWARGLAVLLMIEAHTLDAWTRPEDRSSFVFGSLSIVGGFAAPLFLWLAGLGSSMSAARVVSKTGSRQKAVAAVCRRGAELFLLAFLFRLQAFVVSPGGPAIMLLRVDILNVMGPAIAAAGLLWALSDRRAVRIGVLSAMATAIAMITPAVRAAHAVDSLPALIRWYLRPAGALTAFTLLPWSGFVLAGAAAGAVLLESLPAAGSQQSRNHSGQTGASTAEWRALLALAGAGMGLVLIGVYTATLPTIYAVSSFWTSSPTWFAIRVGLVMIAFALLAGLQQTAKAPVLAPFLAGLERLGRGSLFVYWIHVELVYGYASWFWRRSLPVWGTVCGFAVLSMLMYAAVVARDRYRAARSAAFPHPATVSQA